MKLNQLIEIFDGLQKLDLPQTGCLIGLERGEIIVHAGVVTQSGPLGITHRPDTSRPLECDVPLGNFVGPYIQLHVETRYYEPKS